MRIGIVGGGVAGLYAAWHLGRSHQVTLFEADSRLGGHADTHQVEDGGRRLAIDTGFIVFNRQNYPLFSAWLDALGVGSRPTEMSFALRCDPSGLEYNATTLDGLFCQRRNLLRPRFLGMVRDILRFYRMAPGLLESAGEATTLGEWLPRSGLGKAFAEDHLLPMASALWSSPVGTVREFPLKYLLEFMRNHDMFRVNGRPEWRTITGGSGSYVSAAVASCRARLEPATPVRRIRRERGRVVLATDAGEAVFDQVVMACHADQALALLDRPDREEREILGAFGYEPNEVVLHNDPSRMPVNPRAWASWNVLREGGEADSAQISYCMNRLQGLPTSTPWIVSLNQTDRIDPARVHVRRSYRHPVYRPRVIAAQNDWHRINGTNRTWFCGAAWGWGFHEDAVRSARRVVDILTAVGDAARAA